MQQTVLITVQGTRRRLDIELPGDIPINDLIPLLQEMCNTPARLAANAARPEKTFWTLYLSSLAQPLKGTQTLLEAGVLDGDVLLLQASDASPKKPVQTGKRDFARTIQASEQTGMIGVEWKKSWPI